jgi:hypothetical protein
VELSALPADQLRGLAEEFPVADPSRMAAWRPVFQFYRHLPPTARARLDTPDGLELRDAGVVARSFLLEPPDTMRLRHLDMLEAFGDRSRLWLQPGKRGTREQEIRFVRWQIQAPSAPPAQEFVIQPRRPLQPD